MSDAIKISYAVLVASTTEWEALLLQLNPDQRAEYPFGSFFWKTISINEQEISIPFFHIGWGKISSAAGTQYVIDHWSPEILITIGTCGGIKGKVAGGDIILVTQAKVYDLSVSIGDPIPERFFYQTNFEHENMQFDDRLNLLKAPIHSADRDLRPEDIISIENDGGVIADWESASIAFVARKNGVRCFILKYVSDLVDSSVGEAYEDQGLFQLRCQQAMQALYDSMVLLLPALRN